MSNKINPLIYQVLNIITVITVIIVNMLANILPLNGVTTAQVSDAYPNLFTPAGYVFSIWFIIYLQALIFLIYQARTSQRTEPYLQEINVFYFIGGLLNIAWIFTFHYSFGVPTLYLASVAILLLFYIILLFAYLRLGVGIKETPRNHKLAIHLHFSVYLGWLSLASIAAIASALNILIPSLPIDIQALWTVAVLVIVLLLTFLMVYLRKDFAFALVVIWASIGIGLKQLLIPTIAYTAFAVAIIVVVWILIVPFLKKTNFIEYYLEKR